MRQYCFVLVIVLLSSCGAKPSGLSVEDLKYVRATLAIMRIRANPAVASDSIQYAAQLDAIYKMNGMTKATYVNYSESLSKNPQTALNVYNAIRDSLNSK